MSELAMPMAAFGFVAVATSVARTDVELMKVPFQRSAGTPIAVANICCVPEFSSRMNMNDGSFQGWTTLPCAPKPKTRYAASALIEAADEEDGAMNTIVWMGPRKSWVCPMPFGK